MPKTLSGSMYKYRYSGLILYVLTFLRKSHLNSQPVEHQLLFSCIVFLYIALRLVYVV